MSLLGGKSGGGCSGFLVVTDLVMFILTVMFAAALLMAYAAGHVDPNDAWMFAFAGLVAPILFILNIITLLYWIIRWKLIVFLPVVVLLVGVGKLKLFFHPTISKHYTATESGIKVVTYNVEGFMEGYADNRMPAMDSIGAFLRSEKPDIICIQEFQCYNDRWKARIDSLFDMPYQRVNYSLENSRGGGLGLAVYSRHPIIGGEYMRFENSTNSSMWVDIVLRGDTVRVFNNHLQTTSVDGIDREYINNQEFLFDRADREEKVRSILSKLGRNYRIRAAQADSIAPLVRNSPHKVIVCGDFNDTPMSYVYNTIGKGLADAFAEKGQGMTNTNTFKGLFNLFRIDYILYSKDFRALHYHAPALEFSDHKPVIAVIDHRKK